MKVLTLDERAMVYAEYFLILKGIRDRTEGIEETINTQSDATD